MGENDKSREKTRYRKALCILDYAFLYVVILFLTFIALHGKQTATFIINNFQGSGYGFDILEPSYNNHYSWIGMFIMPTAIVFLRWLSISIKAVGFWGSFVGVMCCLAFFLFSPLKSPIIFFTQGFLYAVSIVVIGTETYFGVDHKSSFWELIFSTISKLVGFIIVLYGAGSAVLRFISSQSQESVDGYISSFLYPTVIIVGVLFMLGYWVLIPVLEKIHEKNVVKTSVQKKHWWPE